MKYRGGERITPLPLTQDMIRQLALEAEFRGLNVGELVGGLVRATMENNLVRQVLDPRAKRPDPVRQPMAAQRGKKKPRRKSLSSSAIFSSSSTPFALTRSYSVLAGSSTTFARSFPSISPSGDIAIQ
jgi:hypothetical protein